MSDNFIGWANAGRENPRVFDSRQAFEQASALHAQGRLHAAEQLYESVLAADPHHFECVYRLGLIRLQQGRFAEAEPLFRRALKLDKRSADAQHHLAIALTGLGRLDEAVARYEKALTLRPRYAEAHNNLGHALQMLQRHDEAVGHYQKALTFNPAYPEAHNNLGNALAALGRTEEAVARYRQVLVTNPAYAEAHNNLAAALISLNRHEDAARHSEQALALRPRYLEAHINLANALAALGRLESAMTHYEQAIAIAPAHAEAHTRLGHALLLLGREDAALRHCEHALGLKAATYIELNNLGTLLWKLHRSDEALASYDRALALKPDYVPTLVNRANALAELGRAEEALAAYARARGIKPDYAGAHLGEARVRLRLGDLRLGFEKFEWRSKGGDKPWLERDFDKPRWLGTEEIGGKTILVHSEQGLGDTLQFCRYAELLAEKGAKVVLEVYPALKSLLDGLAGVDAIIARSEALPDFDFHCPIMSLPLAFKTTLETIPAKTPYLKAAPELVTEWERRLGGRKRLRVGLVWSGSPHQLNDHNRSMPMRHCLPLFLPDIQFVSLQKEVRPRDLECLKSREDLIHFGEELRDFSDTAALVSRLDLVISVCTSVGHLAGALNKPIWFLLPYVACWRWLQERDDSPWYPSARLFRQPKPGDWTSVVEKVASELAEFK